jgi:hypothetical protein
MLARPVLPSPVLVTPPDLDTRVAERFVWLNYVLELDFRDIRLDFRESARYAQLCELFETAEAQCP